MMNKIVSSIFLFASVLLFATSAEARRRPVEAGATTAYQSPSGRFSVKVTAEVPGGEVTQCQLFDGNRMVSQKTYFGDPGVVAISDSGTVMAMLDWGWYDEGASSGVSFYDSKWNLIKKVSFHSDPSGKGQGAMKWISAMTLSPDGAYCAIGENGKEKARVTLYRSGTGEWLWEKEYGLPEVHELAVSRDGKYLLAATHNYGPFDMQVLLLDIEGNVLWRKDYPKSYTWDIKRYLRFTDDGKGFEILEKDRGAFAFQAFPEPSTVKLKKG